MIRSTGMQRKAHQRGAVAVIVALSLVVLLGMLGLVIDLGHLFVVKTELQNAADACALAAAKELTGVQNTQLHIAENAGITAGGYNKVDFQGEAVAPMPQDISFSANLAGPYDSRGAVEAGGSTLILSMRYARCSLQRADIPMFFMQLMGYTERDVAATAVAKLLPSTTNCAIPLGVCRQSPPPGACAGGGTPDQFGLCPGQWYSGRFSAGGGSTGSFNWIDFSPPAGGADEMSGLLTGSGQCNLNITTPVGQTGVNQSAASAWNSRFGLYRNGAGSPTVSTAPPDFTGYSYTATNWPSQQSALPDFRLKRNLYASYGLSVDTVTAGNTITGLSISNAYQVASHGPSGQLASSGADRRLATAPIVDCAGWAGSQTVPILGWACVLMLHPIDGPGSDMSIEYLGLASAGGSPCATTGLPAGPSAGGPLVPALVQ